MGRKKKAQHFLAPEYRSALEKLHYILNLSENNSVDSITSDILLEGNFQMTRRPFSSKSIPSGETWRWNQTKSRKQGVYCGNTVEFYKLCPRKTSANSCNIPLMKLWYYKVTTNNGVLYVLWCERGFPDETLNITDYMFLAPLFENHSLARSIWPAMDQKVSHKTLVDKE